MTAYTQNTTLLAQSVPADYDLDQLDRDITRARDAYHGHWVLPLSTCYNVAFANVSSILEATRAELKNSASLFASLLIVAVAVPVGGFMTARLGHAVLSQAAGNAALRVMSRSSQTAILGTGVWFLENDAARFMLGSAFKDIVGIAKFEVIKELSNAVRSDPFAALRGGGMPSELQFRNSLEQWLYDHINLLRSIVNDVRNNPNLSDAEKTQAARLFRQSEFMQLMPESSTIAAGDEVKTQEAIELALWCGVLLEMDYQEVSFPRSDPNGLGFVTGWTRGDGIAEVPGDANYPTNTLPNANPLNPDSHFGGVRVRHDAPGWRILERVEALYGTHIGGVFLDGAAIVPGALRHPRTDGFDAGEMRRAANALRSLSTQYMLKL